MSSTTTSPALQRTGTDGFTSSPAVPASVLSSEASAASASLQSSRSAAAPSGAIPSAIVSPSIDTQTPIFACIAASYNWTGGTPPYPELFIIQSADANASIYKTLPSENTPGSASWGVDILPGTSITFVIKDSLGQIGYSVPIVIETGKTLSCIPGHQSHTAAIAGGVVGGVGGALALALFLWFFCYRPSKRHTRIKDTYGQGPADEDAFPKGADPVELNTIGRMTTAVPGSFNLHSVDFNPDSLDRLNNAALPTYTAAARAGRRRRTLSEEDEQIRQARHEPSQ